MYKVGDVVEIVNDEMVSLVCAMVGQPPLCKQGERGVIKLIDSDEYVALSELDITPNPNNSDGYVWVRIEDVKLVSSEGEPE